MDDEDSNGTSTEATYKEFKDEDNKECNDKYNEGSNEEFEPDIIRYNQKKITYFRRFGLFLVYMKNGKYKTSEKRVFLSYIVWYLAISCCFVLSYLLKEGFKGENYEDKIEDLIEASFVVIFLGIIPAFWIYLLREYNTKLPQILKITKQFEKTEVYKKLEFINEHISRISYYEGWQDYIGDDDNDEESFEIQEAINKQWLPMKYGPIMGFTLSLTTCVALITFSFFKDIINLIVYQPDNSLKHLKKELPFFIMTVLYPIPYFISIWFCIFFLEWQRKIHESVRHHIRRIKNTIDTTLTEKMEKELEGLIVTLIKAQKVFLLLNKWIFQKTIGIAFTLFMFMGIFCVWKVLQGANNFGYGVPLSSIIGHIYVVCSWSNALMNQFCETNDVLNDMHKVDVKKIRRILNMYPPQVLALGGFKVNFSMMTAVIAFIISCVSIPEEMWPESSQHCYQYDTGHGTWNGTLCIKWRLFIKTNQTLSLRNEAN